MSRLPDAEVEEMLKKLSSHFGEPVMPVSRYCRALKTWVHQIVELNEEKPEDKLGRPKHHQGEAYWEHLHHILIDVQKSNLLYRLIYQGEPLRSKKCPEHNGRWSGLGVCQHGCDLTGWIP